MKQLRLLLLLACRYSFGRGGGQGLALLLRRLSVAAIALSVGAMLMGWSLLNGFKLALDTELLSKVPHLTLHCPSVPGRSDSEWESLVDQIQSMEEVRLAHRYIAIPVILTRQANNRTVVVQGLPRSELKKRIEQYGDLSGAPEAAEDGWWFGLGLLRHFNAVPTDRVRVWYRPLGASALPRTNFLTITGSLDLKGLLDQSLVLTSLTQAQRSLKEADGKQIGIMVHLKDPFALPEFRRKLLLVAEALGGQLEAWDRRYGHMYQDLRLVQATLLIVMLLFELLASLMLVALLVMLVKARERQFALLRALGASGQLLFGWILTEGLLVGLFGMLLGVGLGLLGIAYFSDLLAWLEQTLGFSLLAREIYFTSVIPMCFVLRDLIWILGGALAMLFAVLLYPAARALKRPSVSLLRG